MPNLNSRASECRKHLDVYICFDNGVKWCSKCGKIIKTYEDEMKIKVTQGEGI